ncbi:MAG: phage tail-like protein [Myxococcota bacterium]|jgi:phage tail-like protein
MNPTVTALSLGTVSRGGRSHADYRYIQDVVRIGFPVRAARTFLNRHLGNPVSYRLVEAGRGETVGHVRLAEVIPRAGGATVQVTAERTLPDGSKASYFAPDELVTVKAVVTAEGGEVPPLRTRDRIVLHVPVRSYLRFMPGIFQGAAPSARRDVTAVSDRQKRQYGQQSSAETPRVDAGGTDQFRDFLLLFQHMMTTVTEQIDQLPSLTDPLTADPSFLPWIASWVSFELDESLPLHQQRELVRRSIRLHRTRGTCGGVEEMIRVLTSAPVAVTEREKPLPCVLGAMTLAGGRDVEERFLRDEPTGHYILRADRAQTTFFVLTLESRDRFRERFGERATAVLRRISQIVTREKPANVTFTIRFDESVDA